METPQQSSNARLAAVVALVAVFIVLIIVIATSLGGGGGSGNSQSNLGGGSRTAKGQKQSTRKIYVVKPGDTFSRIAQKVGISVEQLQSLNPHIDQFTLQSGDRVKLR